MDKKGTEIDTKPRKSILWIIVGSIILVCGMVGAIVYGSILIEGIAKTSLMANGSVVVIQWIPTIGIYYVFLAISVTGLAILSHGISLRH